MTTSSRSNFPVDNNYKQPSLLRQEFVNDNTTEKEEDPTLLNKISAIVCRRFIGVIIIFLILVILTPTLLFYFISDATQNQLRDYNYTCLIEDKFKIPCGKANTSFLECITSSCCYNFSSNACYQFLPSKYFYNSSNENSYKSSQTLTPFLNKTIPELSFTVLPVDKHKLQINLNSPSSVATKDEVQDATYCRREYKDRLGVEVYRSSNNDLLLTTLKGPVIASDGYWEWNFYLKNEYIYGLGEIVLDKNKTISKIIYKNKEDHNTLPILMAYLNEMFHGVYIESDGLLEVTILPSQLIILRSLPGNKIILNVCTGPTPRDVRDQLRLYTPQNLPYWALGAHICRDGVGTLVSVIDEYKAYLKNNDVIEFSSDCIHEALYILCNKEDNYDDCKNLIQELKPLPRKPRFVMSLSPQVLKKNKLLYDKTIELNVNYLNKSEEPYVGDYLKEHVIYPDFTHKNIESWLKVLKESIPDLDVKGFVLRDNWLTDDNYTYHNEEYKFPYMTDGIVQSLSNNIAWNAITPSEKVEHILKHNQYGASQTKAVKEHLTSDFLITSSYDYGISEIAQIQNIDISWPNFKKAISTTLYHSFFVNPYISIPVCGSTNNNNELDEALCIRWYLAAATFPIFRISSDYPRRDPFSLKTKFATDITLDAIKRRYYLLPYYHTILSHSDPLIRPMFYDYYSDNETLSLDEQYMIGDALLVAQPVTELANRLQFYLPPSVSAWYEFWGGRKSNSTGWVNTHIVESDWIMYIAAGHVVPFLNNEDSIIGSSNPDKDAFGVAVALKCNVTCSANGTLKFTDQHLRFEATEEKLCIKNIIAVKQDIECNSQSKMWPSILQVVNIYGHPKNDLILKLNHYDIKFCEITEDEHCIMYFSIA